MVQKLFMNPAAAVIPLLPKKDTLSAQVTRYLLDHIASEGLKPGDPMPSEVKITHDLNISRGIVREAYRALATLGILEIESGKTPRVQSLNASVLMQMIGFGLRIAQIDPAQVLQLRRAVEIEAARLAAQHGTPAQFQRMQECVDAMRDAGTDYARMTTADMTLHTVLGEATGNPLFALMLAGLRGPLEESMVQGLKSRRTREEVLRVPDIHEAVVKRICARDAEGATQAMVRHFDVSIAAILKAGTARRR